LTGINAKESPRGADGKHAGEWRVSEVSVNSSAKPLEVDGFSVVPRVIDETRCEVLASCVQVFQNIGAGSRTLLTQS
jgi:hypothetical protein